MGQQYSEINDAHRIFIEQQKIFFVGTAAETGRVNISPKGGDSIRVINANQVAWLNLTGSGNESAAHVLKTRRMTVMFCAFDGTPLILRLYGNAYVIHPGDSRWANMTSLFPSSVAARQVFVLDVDLVQNSCGMSVPFYDYVEDREALATWSDNQGQAGIEKYWLKKNQKSIDGFDTDIANRSGLVHKKV